MIWDEDAIFDQMAIFSVVLIVSQLCLNFD